MKGQSRKIDIRAAVCIAAIAAFALGALLQPSTPVDASREAQPLPTPRSARYTQFAHSTKAHRADCGTCHKFPSKNWKKVRAESAAFPDITEYPSHNSCIKCHTQQFFRGARPAICSICHTNPGPRNSARHPFPNPRENFDKSAKGKTAESDFVVGFPHDKHIEIVSAHSSERPAFMNVSFANRERRTAAEESCAVCHQTMTPQGDSDSEYVTKPPATLGDGFWIKKGMFKSSPIGHTTCFTCHSEEAGMLPAPNNCAACHQLKPPQPPADVDLKLVALTGVTDKVMLDAWRKRDSSGTFRHEWFSHAELSCSTCHNVMTMNTADPATKKVPLASCATCHATPTADDGGAINFEIDARKANPSFSCVKCHTTFGKLPVPESHTKAVAAVAGN
jgi:hypothetical protein